MTEITPLQASRLVSNSALPVWLIALLERRYLAPFNPAAWTLAGDQSQHYPLLRQLLSISRSANLSPTPHWINACHQPGHALILVMHGAQGCHQFFTGTRRLSRASFSTQAYLAAQESVLKAYLRGCKTAACLTRLDDLESPMRTFIEQAPAIGLLTGIPSLTKEEGRGRALDRLANAMRQASYLVQIVAEPVESETIDQCIDACRRLKSEVHALCRLQTSSSESVSEGTSVTEMDDMSSVLATLSYLTQAMPGVSTMIRSTSSLQGRQSRSQTMSTSASRSASRELLDANAEACEKLLVRHLDRLEAARSTGWWNSAIYLAADSDSTLRSLATCLRSLVAGDQPSLDPVRLVQFPELDTPLRDAMAQGTVLRLTPVGAPDVPHPLGPSFETLGTCLSSGELAAFYHLPEQEVPGFCLVEATAFGLSVQVSDERQIPLGSVLDDADLPVASVGVPLSTLNRHAFITGMPGYGKTNTCMNLLLGAYEQFGRPFLVIEPAKAEYRQMARWPALARKIAVYSLDHQSPLPLRINPLAPVPGVPLGRHIDMLKAIFNASFAMGGGMDHVLEEALIEIYLDRGWNLYSSGNRLLNERSGLDDTSALIPSLQDLHDKIETVLVGKGYAKDIHTNIGAALRSRIHSLTLGNKGLVLDTRRSTPLSDLFDRPVVIELQNLGNDDEKCFVMALLFVLLFEYAEARQTRVPLEERTALRHLTLIEEAHRLLSHPRAVQSDAADPRGKAITTFTAMLAEMRALGEGFLIADQSPTAIVSDVMKHSNLKIAHRLNAQEDRRAIAASLGLTDCQAAHLNNLSKGTAVIHDDRFPSAARLSVQHLDFSKARKGAQFAPLAPYSQLQLHRHGGCACCDHPCHYLPDLPPQLLKASMREALTTVVDAICWADFDAAWAAWSRLVTNYCPDKSSTKETSTFACALAQQTQPVLTRLIQERNRNVFGTPDLRAEDFLLRDSAARSLAFLFDRWLKPRRTPAEPREAFNAWMEQKRIDPTALTTQSMHWQPLPLSRLFSSPPLAHPGCTRCPRPCITLAYLTLDEIKSWKTQCLNYSPSDVILKNRAQRASSPQLQADDRRALWQHCLLSLAGQEAPLTPP